MTPPTFPRPRRTILVLGLALAAGAFALPGSAAPANGHASAPIAAGDGSGPAWASLTAAQHAALGPLAGEWNGIDATRKQKWLEIAARFPTMPADEQQRMHERMSEWARMTPQQRTQARLNFQQSRQVSKEERQARWQAYQALPDDKKQELAQRAAPANAGASVAGAHPRPPTPVDAVQPKSNVVRSANPVSTAARPVAPVVIQARPGATTTLLTKAPAPPAHQTPGQLKIAGGPADVDRTTLLPKRGPQGAPMRAASSAASRATPARPTDPPAAVPTSRP